jgi:hypothetical protein
MKSITSWKITLEPPAEISEETWKDFDEILHAALSLPPALREMIAEHLLASLDGPNQKKVDAALGRRD